MLTQNGEPHNGNGIHSNSIRLTPVYPACPSDYESRPIDVMPESPQPKWRDAWPMFTHNCGWTDSDGKTQSLTIRTDDADELFGILKAVKHIVRQSKEKAAGAAPQDSQDPQAEPNTQPCPIHSNAVMQKRVNRSGGHFYSHRLANSEWCKGRAKQ